MGLLPKDCRLPNGAELPVTPPSPLRFQPSPFQLLYFGAHGPANALDNVIDAMSLLQRRGVGSDQLILRLIGDGSYKASLQQRAEALGLTGVYFEPPVPKGSLFWVKKPMGLLSRCGPWLTFTVSASAS